MKVRTKNYDELGHSKHSALEFCNIDIIDIHKILSRCLLSLSPCSLLKYLIELVHSKIYEDTFINRLPIHSYRLKLGCLSIKS